MPSIHLQRILLFSEDIDLLSELYFYARDQKLLVEACNNVLELVHRARRLKPDILLIDEDTYRHCNDFSDAAKAIKAAQAVRVILLVKNLAGLTLEESVVDDTRFLSKDVIFDLFK